MITRSTVAPRRGNDTESPRRLEFTTWLVSPHRRLQRRMALIVSTVAASLHFWTSFGFYDDVLTEPAAGTRETAGQSVQIWTRKSQFTSSLGAKQRGNAIDIFTTIYSSVK
jgi:hypothetical protein